MYMYLKWNVKFRIIVHVYSGLLCNEKHFSFVKLLSTTYQYFEIQLIL